MKSVFSSWAESPDCVVICGGKGTRISTAGSGLAKSMVPVAGRPILGHLIDAWRPHVGRFVFVLNHFADQIVSFLDEHGICHALVREAGPGGGIANALLRARDEVHTERFIMVLGDCLFSGRWSVPGDLEQGIGIWTTSIVEDITRSYSVELGENGRVRRLVEKPREIVNDLCGTGFYFLEQRAFGYVERQQPSPRRGQVEITEVLATMADAEPSGLGAVMLDGDYVNVTYPPDLRRAERIVASAVERQ